MSCNAGLHVTLLICAVTLSCVDSGKIVEGPPSIQFEETEHDFGKLRQAAKATWNFQFQNAGGGILDIEEIRKSCGCTAARALPESVRSGESGSIEVEFNTKGYKGKITKRIRVHSNDPEQAVVTLTVTGTIVADYSIRPMKLHFRHVRLGDTKTKRVQIIPEELTNVAITKVESHSELITAEVVENEEGEEGLSIEVTFTAARRDIPRIQVITIFTNSDEQPMVEVPVYVEVVDSTPLDQ